MRKTGTGLLWSLPEMWEVGKNCHLENIVCPHCQSLETACVLHTQGEPLRSHLCQNCGGYISANKWRLATPAENSEAGSTADLVTSQKMASAAGIAERCGASCCAVEEIHPGAQGTLF